MSEFYDFEAGLKKKEFYDARRMTILEHGGVVHMKAPHMGIDKKSETVDSLLLWAILQELRQIRYSTMKAEDNDGFVG